MTAYYLRAAAVNLAHFVYDTEDLSTVRGGGLLLLDSPAEVETLLAGTRAANVTRITAGASQAVFAFDADSPDAAEQVRAAVEAGLRGHEQYRHATFVLDIGPVGPNFRRDMEILLARTRWRQMAQLRLAALPENTAPWPAGDWPYCGVDLVRPAVERNHTRNDDKRRVSASVKVRADYGRDEKHSIYEQRAVALAGVRVANHFHEIAARGDHRVGADRTNPDPLARLNDKIAVVYIDGNDFDRQGRRHATDPTRQAEWDRHIQDFRKKTLTALLNQVNGTDKVGDQWKCKIGSETVARLETLLWGGDELVWVVPAWKGWEVVRLFFAEAREFYKTGPVFAPPPHPATTPPVKPLLNTNTRKVPNLNPTGRRAAPKSAAAPPLPGPNAPLPSLTHACGLVFAHADAPIQGLVRHAKDLAEVAKTTTDRKADAVAYAVLESFDAPAAVGARLGFAPEKQVIRGRDLPALLDDLRDMTSRFPRGSVYRLLQAFREAKEAEYKAKEAEYKNWLERAEREAGAVPVRFPRQLGTDAVVNWLHLAELWDYLPED